MTRVRVPAPWPEFIDRFHHDRAGITEETLGSARGYGTDPYEWLIEPLEPGGRLLDLACGSAPIGDRRGWGGWIGVDRSSAELSIARRRGAVSLLRADARRLPLAPSSFPTVVCSMAIMIVQPLDAVLGELRRVLTRRGLAVLLLPGSFPLTPTDLARYTRLMIALRRSHLAYPNDRTVAHLAAHTRAAGLSVVDDRRRRFALPIPDADAGRLFVRSLYLPEVPDQRVEAASTVAARWAGSEIGIPLRRITLRRD